MNWKSARNSALLWFLRLTLLEWDRMHTDILTIQESGVQFATLSDDNPAAPQLIAQVAVFFCKGLKSLAGEASCTRKEMMDLAFSPLWCDRREAAPEPSSLI